jgi:hypothetical protein
MEQGATSIPAVTNDPDDTAAPMSFGVVVLVGERADVVGLVGGFVRDRALRRRRQDDVGLDIGYGLQHLQRADSVDGARRAGDGSLRSVQQPSPPTRPL